jgi:membrane protease YdiL (CAAX protease family)
MDNSDLPVNLSRTPLAYRLQAFIEVLLMSGLISTYLAALVFSAFHEKRVDLLTTDATTVSLFILLEAVFALIILVVILKSHRETICSLGLQWERWKSYLLLGLGLVPLFFLINALVSFIFRTYLPNYYLEQNPLTEMIQTPQQLTLFIISALVAGGIKEELQRAFILTRFRHYLGGAWLGLVLWSIAFGAAHYVQGVQGITIATLYGFIFGIVYLLSGSLIAPIVAHGAYDTLALLAYWLTSHQPH